MADYSELKKLAEAFPDYEWDSNTEPFFNGPSGESLGGGSTGFYCVYGPEFEIDGESYEGVTLVESCPADQAKFICKAKAGILALIAENEALKGLYRMHQQTETREMRDLKADIAGLKTGYEAFVQVNAGLKAEGLRKSRVPAGLYRELVALRELRDQAKAYVDGYLLDEVDDVDCCVSEDQHLSASALSERLMDAFEAHWDSAMSREGSHD